MADKNVTNNSKGDLGLPNGQVIPAGATVLVTDYEKVESNPVVKSWIDSKALKVSAATAEKSAGEGEKQGEPAKDPAKK